jgi:hypothetical protein
MFEHAVEVGGNGQRRHRRMNNTLGRSIIRLLEIVRSHLTASVFGFRNIYVEELMAF